MEINNFLTGVTANITNQTRNKSITPVIIGTAFSDLANLTKNSIDNLTGNTGISGYTFSNGLHSDNDEIKLGGSITDGQLVINDKYDNSLLSITQVDDESNEVTINISTQSDSGHSTTSRNTSTNQFSIMTHRILNDEGNEISISFDSIEGGYILDGIFNKGLGDINDYSNNKTEYSYVTKKMLTGLTGVDFINGLTKEGNTIQLGGEFDKSERNIIVNSSDNTLRLYMGDNMINTKTTLGNNFSSIKTDGISNESINLTYIELLSNNSESSTKVRKIRFGSHESDQFTITDEITQNGLNYASDYSANYGDRSLVDKGFVDKQFGKYNGQIAANGSLTGFTIPKSQFIGKTDFSSVVTNIASFIPNYTTVDSNNVVIHFQTAPLTGNIVVNMVGF